MQLGRQTWKVFLAYIGVESQQFPLPSSKKTHTSYIEALTLHLAHPSWPSVPMPPIPILAALLHELWARDSTRLALPLREVDWVEALRPYRNSIFFDRDVCLDLAVALIKNSTISPTDPELFAFGETSREFLNGQDNMALTLTGCKAICGPQTYYVDAGPRFMTWMLPGK